MLTYDYLVSVLHYCPETGIFTWIKSKSRYQGKRAGSINTNGYRCIRMNGKNYSESRLAWLYMTGSFPSLQIDHENRNILDNRWKNLRIATSTQNAANSIIPRNNTSGYKGVTRGKANKWRAYSNKAVEIWGQYARTS